jgi:hypothetical protein
MVAGRGAALSRRQDDYHRLIQAAKPRRWSGSVGQIRLAGYGVFRPNGIVAVTLVLNRHGTACPGHLYQHPAATGGPDEPGHDGLVSSTGPKFDGLMMRPASRDEHDAETIL